MRSGQPPALTGIRASGCEIGYRKHRRSKNQASTSVNCHWKSLNYSSIKHISTPDSTQNISVAKPTQA